MIKVDTADDQLTRYCRLEVSKSSAAVGFYYFSAIVSVICPVVILLLLNTAIIIQLWRTLNVNLSAGEIASVSSISKDSPSISSHQLEMTNRDHSPGVPLNRSAYTGDRWQRNNYKSHMTKHTLTARRKQGVK